MFYGPTYLNILNIYALCRIDDISWGTKGLDAEVGTKLKQRQESWRTIKLLHVGKYVFWNIVTAFILLSVGNDNVPRFFLTYVIMVILIFTLFLKVFLGTIYLLKYKCQSEQVLGVQRPKPEDDKIGQNFECVKRSLYEDLRKSMKGI